MRLAHKYLSVSSLILFATLVSAGQAADYKGLPLDKVGLKKAAADPRGRPAALIGLIRSNGVDFQITAEIDSELRDAKVAPAVIAAAKDNLRLGNGRRASFLTVKSNLPDAQFDIDGRTSFSVGVTEHPLAPGTYRVTAKRDGYSTQTKTVVIGGPAKREKVDFELKEMSVDEMISEAEAASRNGAQKTVIQLCVGILKRDPSNAIANIMMGHSYYMTKEFPEAHSFLVKGIQGGKTWAVILGRKKGRGHQFGSLKLSPKFISFDNEEAFFSSDVRQNGIGVTDFEEPYTRLLDVKTDNGPDWRLELDVDTGKGKKDKKDFDFYVPASRGNSGYGSTVCVTCTDELVFLKNLINSFRLNVR